MKCTARLLEICEQETLTVCTYAEKLSICTDLWALLPFEPLLASFFSPRPLVSVS